MVLLNMRNLTKSYKDKKAVDSLSLTVNSGEILGLVGPNGAGKTTTIRMITTILPADSGSVEISGGAVPGHCLSSASSLCISGYSIGGLCRVGARRLARIQPNVQINAFSLTVYPTLNSSPGCTNRSSPTLSIFLLMWMPRRRSPSAQDRPCAAAAAKSSCGLMCTPFSFSPFVSQRMSFAPEPRSTRTPSNMEVSEL